MDWLIPSHGGLYRRPYPVAAPPPAAARVELRNRFQRQRDRADRYPRQTKQVECLRSAVGRDRGGIIVDPSQAPEFRFETSYSGMALIEASCATAKAAEKMKVLYVECAG